MARRPTAFTGRFASTVSNTAFFVEEMRAKRGRPNPVLVVVTIGTLSVAVASWVWLVF